MAYILLLVLPGVFGVVRANPQSRPETVKLADALTKGSWYHEAGVGPPNHRITFEGRTLTFCACGHVQQGMTDDTGIHIDYGKWVLEHTDDGDVLILSWDPVTWPHGRIPIKYFEKKKAFDMWSGADTMRFQSVQRQIDPCTAPNRMDHASMPIVKLADILAKGSWEYETKAGTPDHPIARERRTLTFYACGHVRERIINDSTRGYLDGKWVLESTDDGDVLKLSYGYLVDRPRLSVKCLEDEKAIDLGIGSAERALLVQRVETERDTEEKTIALWIGSFEKPLRFRNVQTERDPCTPPK